jgi:hypothetical protein
MKTHFALPAVVCCLVAGTVLFVAPAFAQDQPAAQPPHKYLYLSNESIKPGMEDSVLANEGTQTQAMRDNNGTVHYIGLIGITGTPRALFFAGFDSFADMQKQHDEDMANTKLQTALKGTGATESPMLAASAGSIYMFRDDLSLNAALDITQYRFFDITLFHIANGHYQDWEHLVKLYSKAYSSVANAHWAMFEKMYGEGSDRTFILVTPIKALSEEDQAVIDSDNLPKTVGADQMQMMRELGSKTVESAEADLFAIVPQMSYVPDEWVKASPDFWGKK